MKLEEAIKILKDYLCKTNSEFCKVGAVGIPNKEYFAIETVLNHLTKQEKIIENAKDRIEYYLMGNSTLNDFSVREKELERLLKILNKANEEEE